MSVTLCFESDHAEKYGLNGAILLYHIRHWIELNHASNRNLHEGRTWTYHKQKELMAHFSFWTRNQVRTALDQITSSDGPLIKGKFNTSKYDQTTWYAFKNQDEWIRKKYQNAYEDNAQDSKSRGEKSPIEGSKTTHSAVQNHHPIPDNIPDNNTYLKVPSEAGTLKNFFLSKIQEKSPTYVLKNEKTWLQDFDRLLRIDKKTEVEIREMIEWIFKDPFWSTVILSPGKLREKFGELEIKRLGSSEKAAIEKNRKYCLQAKAKYPEELKDLVLGSTYAMNKANGKDIPLNWPFEKFRPAFVAIFGGEVRG